MKKVAILIICAVVAHNSYSQHSELSADSLEILASYHTYAQKHDSALYFLDLASAGFKKEGNMRKYYMAEISKSYEYNMLGRRKEAVDALAIVTTEGVEHLPSWIIGIAHRIKAEIHGLSGEFNEAVQNFEYAFEKITYEEIDTIDYRRSRAGVFMGLGDLYTNYSYFGKAEESLLQAIELSSGLIWQANSDYEIYQQLAKLMMRTGSLSKALEYADLSISSSLINLPNPEGHLSMSYSFLGDVYSRRLMKEKALEHYMKSLDLARTVQEKDPSMINTLLGIGNVHSRSENFDLAFRFTEEALDLSLEVIGKRSLETASCYLALGILQTENSNHIAAISNLEEAIKIYKSFSETDNYEQAITNFWVGYNLVQIDEQKEGYSNIHKGLSMLERLTNGKNMDLAGARNQMANYYLEKELADSALYNFQKALVANSLSFEGLNVDENPDLENYNNGLSLFESLVGKGKSLELKYKKTNDLKFLQQAYATIIVADGLASDLRDEPVGETDKLTLQSFLSELNGVGMRVCHELYTKLDDMKYLETSYIFGDKNKSNLILRNMNEKSGISKTGIPDSLLFLEQDTHREISYYKTELYKLKNQTDSLDEGLIAYFESELFEANDRLEKVINTLKSDFQQYYVTKYDHQVQSIDEVQRTLVKSNDVLLHYNLYESELYLFVINKGSFSIIRKPVPVDFNKMVLNYMELMEQPSQNSQALEEYVKLSNSLSRILLPDEIDLIENQNLIIVPDNVIALIPFETLVKTDNSSTNFKELDYLVKSHQISYANSNSLLLRQKSNSAISETSVLAFAPVFEPEGLGNKLQQDSIRDGLGTLVWTQQEVSNISGYFDTKSILGVDATEKRFRSLSPEYSVVHIASHGLLDEKNPMYSKLVFSPFDTDSINDGYLNTQEIFNMDIPADMVVLSACNTGLGDVISGEGVLSLASGFFYAGAKSLAMTLWTANDESTANLMNEYYKNLADRQTKGDALRNAKLAHLENADELTSHPYYWAHMVINGNNESIVKSSKLWIYLIVAGVMLMVIILQSRRKAQAA